MIENYHKALKGDSLDLQPLTDEPKTKHWYSPLPLWAVILIGVGVGLVLLGIIAAVVFLCCRKSEGYTVGRRT